MMKAVADQVAVAMARVSNEEALKQSEERFRAIAEATPVGVGVIGVPEAKFLYVNMAYIKTFGYDEGDLIGQGTPQIYWNLDDRDKILGLLRKNGSVADYEARLKRKDGTPFWALCSARPITYDNRPALLGAFVDITERKSSEEKLDRLNRALAALGKSSQAMMRAENEEEYLGEVCDIIVKECGYKMTWIGFADNNRDKTVTPVANAGFEEGYLETLNLTWADTERGRGPTGTAIRTGTAGRCRNMLTDPAFAPWRSEAVKRGYASSIVIPLMGRERAFGAITIYSTEPDPFTEEEEQLLMELARDVSQGIIALRLREARNRAEELLRAERNFSNAVIQTTGGLIVGLDTKGRIQLFNHACEKTTGYTFNEIKGRVFWDFLLLPGERERVKKVFESIQNGPASAEMEYENFWVAKDGARRYIKWANSAIKNKEGEIRLIIGTGIDITERKSIEDAQNFLLQCGYTGSGDDFFRSLARYLSESLDMEYICIDRLAGDGLRAETVAVYNSGIFEPNATYTLKETPCGDVVGKSICCFREKVCALFPRDAALRDLKAESYIGATLWSYDGTPIGLIAIIGQKPLVNPGTAEAMLKLVAIRAAGELERLLAETELKKQAGELKTVNEDLTRFNAAAVNRELRMVELKKELNDVCVRLGETPRYPLVIDDDDDTKRI
jgi:PAS domain S-box-containing protein